MSRQIILTKNRGVAIVDDADFEWLSQWKWHFDKGYAARTIPSGIVYMHRQVQETPKGLSTDHINHNKLDNRRSNLRVCTQSENSANQRLRAVNTSGYKGVTWHKKDRRWQVMVSRKYIGQFKDKLEAAKAYDKAAREMFPGFAKVNEV